MNVRRLNNDKQEGNEVSIVVPAHKRNVVRRAERASLFILMNGRRATQTFATKSS